MQSNQQQQVAVYCTSGAPTLAHCDIIGSVHVAGADARPSVVDCRVSRSRSCGIGFVDHARGRVVGGSVIDCRLAALRVASGAQPCIDARQTFRGNGYDGVQSVGVEGNSDGDDEDGASYWHWPDLLGQVESVGQAVAAR